LIGKIRIVEEHHQTWEYATDIPSENVDVTDEQFEFSQPTMGF
jgi:hypothetical protein